MPLPYSSIKPGTIFARAHIWPGDNSFRLHVAPTLENVASDTPKLAGVLRYGKSESLTRNLPIC